ncbi:glutathione reductase (NADPH) [Litorivivens lipolytica]|uniref:Glutathione reductase (NADPH) n=1 Tax=Litorivivens lipolytica TaxID=1524264 RepID=A0A7W4W3T9_9GAMM|nr:glutathione-disulfide reductase [Litorivivens lipolytica]MBB3046392.1 glutathione reductase (NADPH) [Litorivivens lipolytica]
MSYDYDLFVIGAGSGGVRAARMASSYGAKVAIAEERYLGGTCVNVGCVPKKLFSYAAHVTSDIRNAASMGWQIEKPVLDWPTLRDNKTREIERLNGVYENILGNADVEIIRGHARVSGPGQVEINGKTFRCKNILLAVGGWPYMPDIPGAEYGISSNEIFYLDTLPEKAVVVGGGYIACEFASILNGLGVETTQLYRRDLFLRGFDTEIREILAEEMRREGVGLRFNSNPASIEKQGDQLQVTLENGENLETGLVLFATGRKPLLDGLGLENVNVELNDRGYIAINDNFETSEPGIYALGDVTGGIELTPVALAEGMTLAANLFNGEQRRMDYDHIATAIFSHPNVATVGLSEEDARERYSKIDVYTSRFRHLKHTLGDHQGKVFLKLIVDSESQRVVGAHMLGDEAAEVIQGVAIAVKMGATKADFDATIGIHPSVAEEFVTMRSVTRH